MMVLRPAMAVKFRVQLVKLSDPNPVGIRVVTMVGGFSIMLLVSEVKEERAKSERRDRVL